MTYPKCYIYKTYFFELINSYNKDEFTKLVNYQKCLRTLRKKNINLRDYHRILIPVLVRNGNDESKWCLVSVDLKKFRILFYDSSHIHEKESDNSLNTHTNNLKVLEAISDFFDFYLRDSFENIIYYDNLEATVTSHTDISVRSSANNSSVLVTNYQTPNGKDRIKFFDGGKHNKSNFEESNEDEFNESFNSEESSIIEEEEEVCVEDLEIKAEKEKEENEKQTEKDLNEKTDDLVSNFTQFEIFHNSLSNCKNRSSFCIHQKVQFVTPKWQFKFVNAPKHVGKDGGIFICKFMEYLSRAEPITLSKEDIEYYRVSMTIELIQSKLLQD